MSIKYKTDIVPILTVNAEYINPYAYRAKWLNDLVNKIGVPFFPVALISLLIPFQPWVFYMAFPAKLTYVLGEPICAHEMTKKSIEQLSYDELVAIKDEVQKKMQGQLDDAVAKYGKKPFRIKEFFKVNIRNLSLLPYSMPFGWPLLFERFNYLWNKNKNIEQDMKLGWFSSLEILFRSPKQLFFYLPILGWIPILMRGLKKNNNSKTQK
jgi:hypothetical protein